MSHVVVATEGNRPVNSIRKCTFVFLSIRFSRARCRFGGCLGVKSESEFQASRNTLKKPYANDDGMSQGISHSKKLLFCKLCAE